MVDAETQTSDDLIEILVANKQAPMRDDGSLGDSLFRESGYIISKGLWRSRVHRHLLKEKSDDKHRTFHKKAHPEWDPLRRRWLNF